MPNLDKQIEELQQKADKWMKIAEALYNTLQQKITVVDMFDDYVREAISNYEKARDDS